jgi:hypothetical protein
MPLENTKDILRRLIAKGNPSGFQWAERVINEYVRATPLQRRLRGLRLIQADILNQRDTVTGARHNFADAVNCYVEQMLRTK